MFNKNRNLHKEKNFKNGIVSEAIVSKKVVSGQKFIIGIFLAAATVFSAAAPALADFNPNLLVSDTAFSDTQTFSGAAGIQQFLATKGSVLANTDPTFLQMLREPQINLLKSAIGDPEPNLDHLRSAAQLIWDASQMTGINPQVILVTLEKEQSLIDGSYSSTSREQTALDHAMGFSCPDSTGCSSQFGGFYFQLFGTIDAQGNKYLGAPASLMRSFSTPNGRGPMIDINNSTLGSPLVSVSHVGDTIILGNTQGQPYNAPATQSVTLGDSATAALYRYTPHVYNGNYNFWKFFSTWFKYPNGSLVQISGSSNIYIVSNGAMSLFPQFVQESRGIDAKTATIMQISQSDFSSYTQGPVYSPPDNTVITVQGDPANTYYVFENGQRHPASAFVLSQRKLDPQAAFSVNPTDAGLFPLGSQLTPADGTLIQAQGSPTVYVVENGEIYALTGFTFGQYGYLFKNVVQLPASEVNSYQNGGFQLPKDGTLLKFAGNNTVYLLKDQLLDPISGTIFNLNGYSFKNVVTLSAGEVANATPGMFLPPPDGTYFFIQETGNYYYYSNTTKHSISAYVLKQRNVKKLAVQLSLEEGIDINDGNPLPPKDGTLIQGDASQAIYVITSGQPVALDYATWVKTYKKAKPAVLPQAEVDSYTTAAAVTQSQQ
jgi:hypothetical protein